MSETVPEAGLSVWQGACRAVAWLAVDPAGLGGACLRAGAGPVRERFLASLAQVFATIRRMPAAIEDSSLLGGLDLAATLRAGRPVLSAGLLAEASGGLILAAMAERMAPGIAARLTLAMDAGGDFAVVALDEGIEPDERAPSGLRDRLAFLLDLGGLSYREAVVWTPDLVRIADARARLGAVTAGPEIVEALCGTALALGIDSARATILALRAAHAEAALDGRLTVAPRDAALAVMLVLAPRATRLPASETETEAEDEPAPDERASDQDPGEAPPDNSPGTENDPDRKEPGQVQEMLLAAARSAIPAGLLARLRAQDFRTRTTAAGREGARQKGGQRGRPAGVRAASPGPSARLSLIETLRAAAPWQNLRAGGGGSRFVKLRREDFRVIRREQRGRSTTIFVVDASGSSALNRLAEAKGAVELLLADCYRRRDQVAVVAFRQRGAQVLLEPTRSLVRAKRSLASLPGGGGTPLAAGIDAGFLLAETVRRSGSTPMIVLLTDGRANVTRAGLAGRAVAASEAAMAGRRVCAAGVSVLVLDTSTRPAPEARLVAASLGALYVPLPYASAASVSDAVRQASAAPGRRT